MAQWSEIWNYWKGSEGKFARSVALKQSRINKPGPAKSKVGGKYPHLQPFQLKKKAGAQNV